ncbi:MAG: hypothetical protein M1812_000465 [Candelaria pacifica]|nr:MAG: hypothetical protein M1812_000465 [Candelaria pacifica]
MVWVYTQDNQLVVGRAAIAFCQDGLMMSRAPAPCTAQPGTSGIASLMLHEIVHVKALVGIDANYWARGTQNCSSLKTTQPLLAQTNADSYAQLGSWAWNMGLGSAPYTGTSCLNQAPTLLPIQDVSSTDDINAVAAQYGCPAIEAVAAGDRAGLPAGFTGK